MNSELVKRYIYAATKYLPSKNRYDVAQELESIISDMLQERCIDALPTDKDIRVVLAELGTPNELYQKYSPDAEKALIGPPYYTVYIMLLKIILPIVIAGMIIVNVILIFTQPTTFFAGMARTIGDIISSVFIVFGVLTMIFAILNHMGIKIPSEIESIDSLPPVPVSADKIKRFEPIVNIVLSVIFCIVFLFIPSIMNIRISYSGVNQSIEIFSPIMLQSSYVYIIIFAVLGIGREVFKLIEMRYSKKLMLVTIVTNLLSGIVATIWLTNVQIVNPEIIRIGSEFFEENSEFMMTVISNFQNFFLAVIILALVIDLIDNLVRTNIYKKRSAVFLNNI